MQEKPTFVEQGNLKPLAIFFGALVRLNSLGDWVIIDVGVDKFCHGAPVIKQHNNELIGISGTITRDMISEIVGKRNVFQIILGRMRLYRDKLPLKKEYLLILMNQFQRQRHL